MSLQQPIKHEAIIYRRMKEEMAQRFPDADEETLRDTLDGISDLREALVALVRSHREDAAFAEALRSRISDMNERLGRIEHRAVKKKTLVTEIMSEVEIKKIIDPEFTISLRSTPAPLAIVNEQEVPDEFWKPQSPKIDRKGLIDALKTGRFIAGAILGNPGQTVAIRSK